MPSAVCTLFEGNYHYGVAALANSLYNNGYRGEFYVGYRGSLPSWCNKADDTSLTLWPNAKILQVTSDFKIHLLPLTTDYHFTNYKPDFMISLWEGLAKDAESMFYLDPDIVLTHKWSFFEEWVKCGVALCEDVNSPLPENHPRRIAWRNHFKKDMIILNFKESTYANGGFVGVNKSDSNFLELWKKVQEIMAPLFGGLNRSSFMGTSYNQEFSDFYYPYSKTDQDALNITGEVFEGRLSFIGQEAMSFKNGAALLPHALGQNKPWNTKFFSRMFCGDKPRLVDKEYWKHALKGPISFHSVGIIWLKITEIKIAALVGRFYSK